MKTCVLWLLRSGVLRQIPFCYPKVRKKKHLGGCDGVGEFFNCSWSCLHPISKLGNDKSEEEIDTYNRKTNYKE